MKTHAMITGGTRGIGYGIAKALADDGVSLVLCGRRAQEEVENVLSPLRDKTDVTYFSADIGDAEERKHLLENVFAAVDSIEVLINNAGMAPRERRDILDATEESFEEIIRVNLQAPYFLTQAIARQMCAESSDASMHRCIINIGSVSATLLSLNRGEYCIAKAGVAMATRLWARRLAEENIAVYEVQPGITLTDMTAGVKEKYDTLIAEGLVPQKRWGTPEDIGRIVAALVRGDMPYSTGTVIHADGGMTLHSL